MKVIETNWKWTSGLSTRSSTQYIALHHAAAKTCTAAQIDQWHKGNGWSGIGYHFFVRKDGSIYRGRPLDTIGAHVQGKNAVSVGICAEGDYSTETMPNAQKQAIAELLAYLKKNYYPNAKIVGHGEIGLSACPGKNYPLAELKNYKNILSNESEELTMSQYEELKKLISNLTEENTKLKKQVDELRLQNGYYNYIDDNMNANYRPTIQRLVKEGIIKGNEKGELQLTNDMMRSIVFCDRMINR